MCLHHHLVAEGVDDALANVLVGDDAERFEEDEDVDLGPDVRDRADLFCEVHSIHHQLPMNVETKL